MCEDQFWTVIALVSAFLCGSIPFGFLVAKAKGIDIRKVGSGNIGATNVGRTLGRKWGFLVFGLDFLKGVAGTALVGMVWDLAALDQMSSCARPRGLDVALGVAAIFGHSFCPWLGWRGGKGVATGAGVLLTVFPESFAVAMTIWVVAMGLWKMISLASILSAATLAVTGLYFYWGDVRGVAALLLGALVIWRHKANIVRIYQGTEPRVGASKAPSQEEGEQEK